MNQSERFWAKVNKTETCWLWTGARSMRGYGRFWLGSNQHAHRVAYVLAVGPIPEDLQIDHLCRVRLCVNPAHLEPVTSRENTLRGHSFAAFNATKTHCPHGHAYDEANTRINGRKRFCRTCGRLAQQRHRALRQLRT